MPERHARARHDTGTAKVAPFQVRGRFLTALALRIDTESVGDGFLSQIDDLLRTTPQFFLGAPVVLDFANVPGLRDAGRIGSLVEGLRARDLQIFGVQNAPGIASETLQTLGLIPLPAGREAPPPREPAARDAAPGPAPTVPAKVVRSPVRSGQLIVAEDGDLTIIGPVASGAELVAAGNIHVYGALRGRAMAGCHGRTDAHIFCQSLEAELVAIAGIYRTSEMLGDAPRQRCTHIYLNDEELRMEVVA